MDEKRCWVRILRLETLPRSGDLYLKVEGRVLKVGSIVNAPIENGQHGDSIILDSGCDLRWLVKNTSGSRGIWWEYVSPLELLAMEAE